MGRVMLPVLMAGLSLISGCDRENEGISKLEALRDRYTTGHRGTTVHAPAPGTRDTVIYLTAVEFPDGYDWRRDSSYGDVSGHIVLYRDRERILEIHAGPGFLASLDSDLHHFDGGHVYTESCTADATLIGMDGGLLFSYRGRELLCGLFIEGKEVYTLGQSRSGRGLSLRRGGEEIFSSAEGVLSAHISDRPDYPSGALYRDCGHLYFSYWEQAGDGPGRNWYVVEDGTAAPVPVPDGRMYDIRIRDGEPLLTPVQGSTALRYEYTDGERRASVSVLSGGRLTVSAPCWTSPRYYSSGFFFPSFRCACLVGEHFYIGLNPADSLTGSYLWKDDSIVFRLGINGFITGVFAQLE